MLGHGDSTRSNNRDKLPVIGCGAVDNERHMTKADGVTFIHYVETGTVTMELNLNALRMASCNSEMLDVMSQIG